MGLGKQSKTLNKSQIEMVSSFLKSKRNGLRNQTIFLLSVKSGLRSKEISQLSWKEVLNSDGTVGDEVHLTDKTSKGKSGRIIPLHKSVKDNLINLIKKSDYQLDNNIKLTYIGEGKEKIVIFFKKSNYDLVGWEVIDQLQNTINFSIKIKYVNSEINPRIFKIPIN